MSSNTDYGALPLPVTTLQYRDMASARASRDSAAHSDSAFVPGDASFEAQDGVAVSDAQLRSRIEQERAAAAIDTEQRLRKEFEQKLLEARVPLTKLLSEFETERSHYYARVEAEIVQLALAIAAKILHRETQVDPMLVAALVRLAVEKMRDGTTVTLRVHASKVESWRRYFAGVQGAVRVEVVDDSQLGEQDCFLETELGSANFGLDAQLKEVEQGFFDLLALRPGSR